jgi:hypothetical protein
MWKSGLNKRGRWYQCHHIGDRRERKGGKKINVMKGGRKKRIFRIRKERKNPGRTFRFE